MTSPNYNPESAPAGWYPDPSNDARQRYWDGIDWTPRVRALETPPAQSQDHTLVPGVVRYTKRDNTVGSAAVDPHGFYQAPDAHTRFTPASSRGPSARTGLTPMLLTLLVGALFIGAGLFMYRSNPIPANYTQSATATVVSDSASAQSASCFPTVSYQVAIRSYTATSISSACHVKVGSQVTIYYDPHNANLIAIAPSSSLQLETWVCVGLGAILILIAFIRRFA